MTIKDFFVKLTTGKVSPECNIDFISPEAIDHVELSNAPTTGATRVSLDCNIIEVTSSQGIYIHYRLKMDDVTNSNSALQRNSFTILMQNAYRTQLCLPTFQQSEKMNRKHKLRSDIVEWIQRHGGGWSSQSYANTQGKQFVVSLNEAIWYIDIRDYQKFEERGYLIPDLFIEFFNRANPESYKQSRKSFDENELNLYCQALAPYATSSWMLKENFNWLRDAFDSFVVAISNY
ncbi:hypothetical protein C2G38_2235896, partial [Gigaspora rosea]